MAKVASMCDLLESFLFQAKGGPDFSMDQAKLHSLICTAFLFTFVWCVGGNLVEASMDAFDSFTRELFGENHDVRVSVSASI